LQARLQGVERYHPVTPHTIDASLEVAAAETFIMRQQALMNKAYEKIQKIQFNQAEQYNKTRNSKEFEVDDRVLLSTKHTNSPFLQTKGRVAPRPEPILNPTWSQSMSLQKSEVISVTAMENSACFVIGQDMKTLVTPTSRKRIRKLARDARSIQEKAQTCLIW
jgi:hypothetical protein